MPLFMNEEVCENCRHAVFHKCCGSFCRCKVGAEIDPICGHCDELSCKCEYDADGGPCIHCGETFIESNKFGEVS